MAGGKGEADSPEWNDRKKGKGTRNSKSNGKGRGCCCFHYALVE